MTKLSGSQLRDDIARLLKIRHDNVVIECRLAATTADVLYVDDTNVFLPRKIAIESKDWSKSLTSKNIAEIHNLYQPSLSSREIDSLLIVGRHPLASSPRDSINRIMGVNYVTFDEFQANLINFGPVINDNLLAFRNHPSFENFLMSRVVDRGATLYEAAMNWLKGDARGLVIYGGYGMGKTSFSLYLASELSTKFTQGEFKRIPIRISLGGLFTKQDLTGLICATLTGADGGPRVRDFSYNIFLEMNRIGKFLLIFDGFDEMRHAMDIDDFVYTFEQIRPLFVGDAKIIILGRPDSFFSSSEEDRVISAMFESSVEARNAVEKIEVSLLDPPQVESYVRSFLSSKTEVWDSSSISKFEEFTKAYTADEIDVLLRPVHLNMFTKVLSEFIEPDRRLTKYDLYSEFMFGFSRREQTKHARTLKSKRDVGSGFLDPRSVFMQNVAWWLLTDKKENRFLAEELPARIIPAALLQSGSEQASLREALTGSVIEQVKSGVLGQKGNRVYYFPHKSYIEYLISTYVARGRFEAEAYRQFLRIANAEILDFIYHGPSDGWENLKEGLQYYVGELDYKILQICSRAVSTSELQALKNYKSLEEKDVYVFYIKLREDDNVDQMIVFVRRLYAEAVKPSRIAVALNCASDLMSRRGGEAFGESFAISTLISLARFDLNHAIRSGGLFLFNFDQNSIRAYIALRCFKYFPDGIRFSTIDLHSISDRLLRRDMRLVMPVRDKVRTEIEVSYDSVIDAVHRLSKASGDDTGDRVEKFIRFLASHKDRIFCNVGGEMEKLLSLK